MPKTMIETNLKLLTFDFGITTKNELQKLLLLKILEAKIESFA